MHSCKFYRSQYRIDCEKWFVKSIRSINYINLRAIQCRMVSLANSSIKLCKTVHVTQPSSSSSLDCDLVIHSRAWKFSYFVNISCIIGVGLMSDGRIGGRWTGSRRQLRCKIKRITLLHCFLISMHQVLSANSDRLDTGIINQNFSNHHLFNVKKNEKKHSSLF